MAKHVKTNVSEYKHTVFHLQACIVSKLGEKVTLSSSCDNRQCQALSADSIFSLCLSAFSSTSFSCFINPHASAIGTHAVRNAQLIAFLKRDTHVYT